MLVLPETSANDQGRQLALKKAESRKQKAEIGKTKMSFNFQHLSFSVCQHFKL
jgi:hypothetical protein